MADLNIIAGGTAKFSSIPKEQRITPLKLAVLIVVSIVAAILLIGSLVFAFRGKWDNGSRTGETRKGDIQPPAKSELASFKDLCAAEELKVSLLVRVKSLNL